MKNFWFSSNAFYIISVLNLIFSQKDYTRKKFFKALTQRVFRMTSLESSRDLNAKKNKKNFGSYMQATSQSKEEVNFENEVNH
jgi:hypothetical protein